MRRKTPVRALLEGLVAGAIGAGVQSLFFRATTSVAPSTPPDAFAPPEPEQADESQTETVARRLVEGLAHRGSLSPDARRVGGELVHYGFGAAWGGLYGLVRASYRSARSVGGVAGFAATVWMLGDNLMLPLFKVAGPPQRYPLRTHAYALAAHLAYAAAVAATLAAADRPGPAVAAAAFVTTRRRALGRHAVAGSRALVPRSTVERSRRLAQAIARRARDLQS